MADAGPEAVLFDLDGTLADTLPGLSRALDTVALRHGVAPVPTAALRPIVSRGGRAMVSAAFADVADPERFAALHAEFLAEYESTAAGSAVLFGGIAEAIDALANGGCRWGIVTNKQARFTEPLVASLPLRPPPACVISGDSAAAPKPDPAPLRMACARLGVVPETCVYVGDARTDVVAAHACGMACVAAAWGYIPDNDSPETWGADAVAADIADLLAWLSRC